MSRTKELKSLSENNINLYDWFSLFVPEKKSKYVEVFLRTLKKTKNMDNFADEQISHLSKEYNVSIDELKSYPKIQIIMMSIIFGNFFDSEDLKLFQRFCEYNERGLIKQNDLSKYNEFDDIKNAVSIADVVAMNKDMEKQIIVLWEDDTWLVLRPLTFSSSKKYGSNTKWCTTQDNNPDYFNKYSKKGVLIYCINRITGYKVASFYSLQKEDPEFSFWNQKDQRIDSLETELPDFLRKLIKDVSKDDKAKTNKFLLPESERLKEESLHSYKSRSLDLEVPVSAEQPTPIAEQEAIRPIRVRNMEEGDITYREGEISTLNYQPLEQNVTSYNTESE